jgi:hypothetical protein
LFFPIYYLKEGCGSLFVGGFQFTYGNKMMRKSVNSLVQIFVAIVTVPVVLDPVNAVSSEPLIKITLTVGQEVLAPVTVTELILMPLLRLFP